MNSVSTAIAKQMEIKTERVFAEANIPSETAYTMLLTSQSVVHNAQNPTSQLSSLIEYRRRYLRANNQLVNVTTIKTTKTNPMIPARLPGAIAWRLSPNPNQTTGIATE